MQLAPGVRKISAKLSKMATFLRLSDLTSVTCSPETPTHEVLRRLNESDYLFFIVIDCTGKPLGTITDGDVRRAMLDGATLNDPSSRCMFHQSCFGQLGNDTENIKILQKVPFLPLVDSDGTLV